MRISVIIPVYNASDTIERCIDSLAFQLNEDDEIIVIDDGSSDDSLKKCKELKKRWGIRIYTQSNAGVGATRNRGIYLANNEWIVFVDADDFVDKEFRKKIEKNISDEFDMIFFEHFNEDAENCLAKSEKEYIVEKSDIENYVRNCFLADNSGYGQFDFRSVWANVYKKDFLCRKRILFETDVLIGEDMLFVLDNLDKAEKIKVVSIPIYHYFFKNSASITNRYKPTLVKDIKQFDLAVKHIINSKEREQWYAYYRLNDIVLLMKYTFFNQMNPNKYSKIRNDFKRTIQKGNYSYYYSVAKNAGLLSQYGVAKKVIFWMAKNNLIELLWMISRLKWGDK